MGLNKVGIGPNTAAHRDKLSKSHREDQGLSSKRGTENFTGHTVLWSVYGGKGKDDRRMGYSVFMRYSMALNEIKQTDDAPSTQASYRTALILEEDKTVELTQRNLLSLLWELSPSCLTSNLLDCGFNGYKRPLLSVVVGCCGGTVLRCTFRCLL